MEKDKSIVAMVDYCADRYFITPVDLVESQEKYFLTPASVPSEAAERIFASVAQDYSDRGVQVVVLAEWHKVDKDNNISSGVLVKEMTIPQDGPIEDAIKSLEENGGDIYVRKSIGPGEDHPELGTRDNPIYGIPIPPNPTDNLEDRTSTDDPV